MNCVMESSELSDKSKEDLLEIILDKDNQIQELEEMVIYYRSRYGNKEERAFDKGLLYLVNHLD